MCSVLFHKLLLIKKKVFIVFSLFRKTHWVCWGWLMQKKRNNFQKLYTVWMHIWGKGSVRRYMWLIMTYLWGVGGWVGGPALVAIDPVKIYWYYLFTITVILFCAIASLITLLFYCFFIYCFIIIINTFFVDPFLEPHLLIELLKYKHGASIKTSVNIRGIAPLIDQMIGAEHWSFKNWSFKVFSIVNGRDWGLSTHILKLWCESWLYDMYGS